MVDRDGRRSPEAHQRWWCSMSSWAPLVACNLLVVAIAVVCYAVVFVEVDVNPCIITYMYPNYIRIRGENFSRLESKYELYLYREGPTPRKEVTFSIFLLYLKHILINKFPFSQYFPLLCIINKLILRSFSLLS